MKAARATIQSAMSDSEYLFQSLQNDSKGFEKLSRFLKQKAGIHLPTNAKNLCLMASRLSPVLRDRGMSNYDEYLALLDSGSSHDVQEFISSLTTNTTQFFREPMHFELLKKLTLEIVAEKKKLNNRELRIWCAASSTGQEPYTILMTVLEALGENHGIDIKFLASDIDLDVLKRASAGNYTVTETSSVPPQFKQKYFSSERTRDGNSLSIRPEFGSLIRFAPFNLMENPYPFQHKFDIIFCRNVLIYFEPTAATETVNKLISQLRTGGYLFLGHSESGTMRSTSVDTVSHAVYRRKG